MGNQVDVGDELLAADVFAKLAADVFAKLAADVFAKLAADGSTLMPFEPTFFARKFGLTNDRFGVEWMVSVPQARG